MNKRRLDSRNRLAEKSAKPKDAASFLKHFLVEELSQLIQTDGQPFLKFFPLITGMEFLGACYDDKPFNEMNLSKKRFKKALSLMGAKYQPFNGSQQQTYPCLYDDFRCPMIHQFRTNQDKIRLTAVNYHDSDEVKSFHLKLNDGVYILVLEEFYEDFKEAVNNTISDIEDEKLLIDKLKDNHVVIRDMEILLTT